MYTHLARTCGTPARSQSIQRSLADDQVLGVLLPLAAAVKSRDVR
jgi:hypothetical protein